jgi:hypothetical protein
VKILCTDLKHERILAEYSDPLLWKGSRGQSDQFSQGASHQHANPASLYGPLYLTGAEVCTYHDSDRAADAVGKWYQQKLEPRARAIAG